MRDNEEVALLFLQKIPCYKVDGQDNRRKGQDNCQERFCMKPDVQLIACKNSKENDRKHLERHAGVLCIIIERPLVLVSVHRVCH